MNKCQECNINLPENKNERTKYCSPKCKTSAYRKRKEEIFPISPSVCWFCGTDFLIKGRFKFCCDDHKKKFHKRKELNKPIILDIDKKTKIETKKYDQIPEIIKKWKKQRDFFSLVDY